MSLGSGSARLGLAAVLALCAGVAASTRAGAREVSGPGQVPASPSPVGAPAKPAGPSPGEIQAEPPPFSEGIFPCSQCHEAPGNPKRRVIEFHEDVQEAFHHDSANRWCLDCHDNDKRDMLRLASGAHVPFTESYRLCGQCHGDKYRDWRAGVHGKRVGQWDGQRMYFLCVHCHNPHSPRFKTLKPEPRPARPQEVAR